MFFWNFAFSAIQWMLAIWSLVPLPFLNPSLNIWKFTVHVLLKPGLENFEHYYASVWDEYNCAVVWTLFGIVLLWDWHWLCFAHFWIWPQRASSLLLSSPFLQVLSHIQLSFLKRLAFHWHQRLLCPWYMTMDMYLNNSYGPPTISIGANSGRYNVYHLPCELYFWWCLLKCISCSVMFNYLRHHGL